MILGPKYSILDKTYMQGNTIKAEVHIGPPLLNFQESNLDRKGATMNVQRLSMLLLIIMPVFPLRNRKKNTEK